MTGGTTTFPGWPIGDAPVVPPISTTPGSGA